MNRETHHSGEETKSFQILQNVRRLRGDEDDVDRIEWMEDVADTVRLHKGVLTLS